MALRILDLRVMSSVARKLENGSGAIGTTLKKLGNISARELLAIRRSARLLLHRGHARSLNVRVIPARTQAST